MNSPLRPLEKLNGAAAAVMLAVSVGCAVSGRLHPAWALPVRYALMLLMVGWISRLARPGNFAVKPGPRLFVNFYPLILVPMVYDGLGTLIAIVHPTLCDRWLIAIDRWIFGRDVTLWCQQFVTPWLTALLYLCYATYFVLPVALVVPLWRRNRPVAQRAIHMIALAFYVSYIGYFLVPARGPRFTIVHDSPPDLAATTRLGSFIANTMNSASHTFVDVFPSAHVLVTLVILTLAWRHARRIFWIMVPTSLLLLIATVYCRFHYVIDALAGAALTPLTLRVGRLLFDAERAGVRDDAPARALADANHLT